ncbi:PilZ domain-containing protein [Jiella sp. CQZ9-1]|uniref:PilZ domain-containing protein n=2 Tax=Jiella flava TaxID=2816857 RepID=A0A939G1G5_9HYPH|nr:PilZ domain-containing protein [Jiella flava]
MMAEPPKSDTSDRRRFSRVDLDLLGRFMREDFQEYPCRVENMSPGSVAVISPVEPREGERIIFYVDHIGRLEGKVSRIYPGGFAVDLINTDRKREKLAAQLTWFANRGELDLPEDRRHQRLTPKDPHVEIVLDDDRRYRVKIIDLSLSGAAVQCPVRPALNSRITLGMMQGRVVRHLEEGFAIEFASVQTEQSLRSLLT